MVPLTPHNKKKFYITTPLYYVNATPHIGSLYSTVIADVIARTMRLLGKESFLVTGVDEHGQKVYDAAESAGVSPQKFVDALAEVFKTTWEEWQIEYNVFFRTTAPHHQSVVQEWIRTLQKKDIIYKATYEGWYSVASESFIAEKEIVQRTPSGTPLCPSSGKELVWIAQDAYFFRLSAFQERLLAFYEATPHWLIPHERIEEVLSFVKGGLRDLCISRTKKTLSWGIPFPDDEEHVVYVWADALNNYISAVGYLSSEHQALFSSCWPADLHVMAKEIVIFHAVYWPAFLMASELPLPRNELVHGWILFNKMKMSKSLGNVISPKELKEKYGVDRSRYFFIRHLSVTHDASFSWEEFEERTNAELANALGNLIGRVEGLGEKLKKLQQSSETSLTILPQPLTAKEEALYALLLTNTELFKEASEQYLLHKAYQAVWRFIDGVNHYLQETAPWKTEDSTILERVIFATTASLRAIGGLIAPVMPESAASILTHIGEKRTLSFSQIQEPWRHTFHITKREKPLFNKIEKEKPMEEKVITEKTVKEEARSETISFDTFAQIQLVVGKITEVALVEKSNKLYKLSVDFGPLGEKTICSGIKQYYTEEALRNKKVLFVYNLAPRMLCGITSEGMLLTTKDTEGVPQIVTVPESVPNGTIAT